MEFAVRMRVAGPLVALVLTASGCGKPAPPTEPPPGVKAVLPQAKFDQGGSYRAAALEPGWIGTRYWTERETAVDALRRVGPSALPALVNLLHGPDRDLSELAARAIAMMGPAAKAALPDLIAALHNQDPDVRKNVLRAIGQMGPDATSAIPALVKEIRRPEAASEKKIEKGTAETTPAKN